MKYNKKIIIYLVFFMIGSIYAQDNIINEIANGGKFIVRDVEQNEAMVIEEGNVRFSGTLKLDVLPKGDISNSIVVWDPEDKLLKLQDQNLSTALTNNLKDEGWYTTGYDGLADDNTTTISASVQGTATTKWNQFNTDYGYIKLGPANQYGWAHIYTDKSRFIFNRPVYSYDGSFSSYSSNNLKLQTSGKNRLTVLASNGNIGIGTTNPSAKLDVSGQVKITGGAPGLGKVLTSDATGLATWQTPAAGGGATTSSSTLWTESGSNIYRNDGNVGIGTSPSQKLHLYGKNRSVSGPHIRLQTDADIYSQFQLLNWSHDNISLGFDTYWDGTSWKSADAGSNFSIYKIGDKLRFKYDSGITAGSTLKWNDGIVLGASGNVGIGTSNPSAKLDVNGTVSAKRYVVEGPYTITNGVWDLSQSNLAQVTYNSSITPITINSDGSTGTYVLIVKKAASCTDCTMNFSGADIKYPGGVIPTLSSGTNTTDIFSFIAMGNNTFYCLYVKNLL